MFHTTTYAAEDYHISLKCGNVFHIEQQFSRTSKDLFQYKIVYFLERDMEIYGCIKFVVERYALLV